MTTMDDGSVGRIDGPYSVFEHGVKALGINVKLDAEAATGLEVQARPTFDAENSPTDGIRVTFHNSSGSSLPDLTLVLANRETIRRLYDVLVDALAEDGQRR